MGLFSHLFSLFKGTQDNSSETTCSPEISYCRPVAPVFKADDRIFPKWSNSIHSDNEQQYRIRRSDSPFIYIAHLSDDKRSATIEGETGTYQTNFDECSCEDFKRRQLPCKHMYKLAFSTGRMKAESWCPDYIIKNKDTNPERFKHYFTGDNMSLRRYKVKAIFRETNRIRTVEIYATCAYDATQSLPDGYVLPPKDVSEIAYPSPTERQIQYALYEDINIPQKCCQTDLSIILDQGKPLSAPKELIDFAIKQKIDFSLYSGERTLIRFVYYGLHTQELKIAFVVANVYRYLHDNWDFSNWEDWIEFSKRAICNDTFLRSFKRSVPDEFEGIYEKRKQNYFEIIEEYLNREK